MPTSNILMIRPAAFAFNPQTAVNNKFQKVSEHLDIHQKALAEFDNFVELLRFNGIQVNVIQDVLTPHTPDSIFPNNWVSFHEDGTIIIYPMFAPNRQLERSKGVIEQIEKNYFIRSKIDLTVYEQKDAFLEGTGSMVLDRDNRIAYACLSARTNATVLYDFAAAMDYTPVLFNAVDANGNDIYHTNVLMCMASEYVVICLEAISDNTQQEMLINKFNETGKEIIEISMVQMNQFAGNMLQLENVMKMPFCIMSSHAFNSLTEDQISLIQSFNPILHAPLSTIEQSGGGSARCMIAEIFLPEINN